MRHIPLKYVPKRLTQKDKQKQLAALKKSRRLYKRGVYFKREKVASFSSKPSHHVYNAQQMYHVDKIRADDELALKTGCSVDALQEIIKKGEGAYFSSGSRPNQTAQSWGVARLASAITAGKAAAVDYSILEKGCKKNSKALQLAKQSVKRNGHGTRRVAKV